MSLTVPGGYQLKPGHFVNSTCYLRMIFYPFLLSVSRPSALLSIQTGLESLSQIIVQLLLFHRISLDQSYEWRLNAFNRLIVRE